MSEPIHLTAIQRAAQRTDSYLTLNGVSMMWWLDTQGLRLSGNVGATQCSYAVSWSAFAQSGDPSFLLLSTEERMLSALSD